MQNKIVEFNKISWASVNFYAFINYSTETNRFIAHYPSAGDPVCKGFNNIIDAVSFLLRYKFKIITTNEQRINLKPLF